MTYLLLIFAFSFDGNVSISKQYQGDEITCKKELVKYKPIEDTQDDQVESYEVYCIPENKLVEALGVV